MKRLYPVNENGSLCYYPSVTTVLESANKVWLDAWRERVGEEIANIAQAEGAANGSRVHELIAQIDRGGIVSIEEWDGLNSSVRNALIARERWSITYNYKPVATEVRIYSSEYGYAGTLDAFGTIGMQTECRYAISDWKTSKMVTPSMKMQLAAYFYAYKVIISPITPDLYIVQLNKDTGLPTMTKVEDWESWFTEFLGYLDKFKLEHGGEYEGKDFTGGISGDWEVV